MARPKYSPSEEHLHTAYIGAKKGLSERDIAKAIGISYKTFQRNLGQFRPHVKKGRDESKDVDCKKIENTLVKRCVGYFVKEELTETRITGQNSKPTVIKRTTKKWVHPSDMLTIFVLCNRMPEKYRSINRPDVGNQDNAVGEIQAWFREIRKDYESIKDESNG